VYTGDEVGAEFEPYATDGTIDWADYHGLRPHFRKLVQLRKELPGLRSRNWKPFSWEPAGQVFGFARSCDHGNSPVVVLLNFSPEATIASLPSSELAEAIGACSKMTDLYNGGTVAPEVGTSTRIPLPPWGIRILVAA
jgi:glycosidase